MKVYNVLDGEFDPDPDPREGYVTRWARFGPQIGGEALGMTVCLLEAGERICPYHFEWGDEEWLLVLEGEPTLRTPAGERVLAAGDVVCFREGPDGAHAVTGPARVAMLSTKRSPSVSEYPDSGKIGVWPGGKLFRNADAVDYWEGEA